MTGRNEAHGTRVGTLSGALRGVALRRVALRGALDDVLWAALLGALGGLTACGAAGTAATVGPTTAPVAVPSAETRAGRTPGREPAPASQDATSGGTTSARTAPGGPGQSGDDRTDPELFLQANQAYEAGSYPQAIAFYEKLLDRGHHDGRLLYNLGNAYLRDGRLGPAVAAYRRSLARQPRDQDARANLDFARRSTRDALAPPTPSPWISTLFFWHFQMSRRELAWTVLVLNLLLWILLALGRLRRRSEALPWLAGGVLLFLLGAGGSLLVHEVWPQQVAVVLPPEIDARSGPGADAVVRYKLHAGTEVAVEDVTSGWVRIEGPERQQAWVEADQVAVIRW